MSLRLNLRDMNRYDIHKMMVNEYILKNKGDTKLLKRDTPKDKSDIDILRQFHQFLWDEEGEPTSWGEKLAKKYYDRLFKEYCIGDLTLYKENKVGLRWRTKDELVDGKGQFSCGEKHCSKSDKLRTWEVNFGYVEKGVKKNALVKLRLCPQCSHKLNYNFKKKEVKRLSISHKSTFSSAPQEKTAPLPAPSKDSVWQETPKELPTKMQNDVIDEFLEDLFL